MNDAPRGRNNGNNFDPAARLNILIGVKLRPCEFQTIFATLQVQLAATKMRCAEVVAKAQDTRDHVQRARARRNRFSWTPEHPPTFVSERSAQVH
jgi:hypothetical protein